MTIPTFRRSPYCESASCVEVAIGAVVQVRDAAGTVVVLDPATWVAFIRDVRAGRFDRRPQSPADASGRPTHQPPPVRPSTGR